MEIATRYMIMNMYKKVQKILIAFVFIIVCILYINSTTWFRLKLAGYYAGKQDEPKLIAIYKKVIRKESVSPQYRRLNNKDYSDIHFALANLYFRERSLTESVDILKRLNKIAPSYENYPFSGTLQDPEDYKKASFCLLRAGFIDVAIIQLQDYLKFRSGDSLGHYQLGLMYQRKNDDNNAVVQFQKAIDTCDQSSDSPRYLSDIYFRLAKILEKKRDLEKALDYYNKAMQLNENNFQVYHQLRWLYTELGRDAEAMEVEEKMRHLKPDYVINYKFDNAVFVGYFLNETEFELFNDGEIVFVWDMQAQPAQPRILNGIASTYRIGDMVYEIKRVENLAPNFGFEIDFLGAGFPCDWNSDYYEASFGAHQIVSDIKTGERIQCLMLDNLREDKTNCQSAYIEVKNGYYLQCGWIKSIGGNAYFGSRWYSKDMRALPYDYVATDIASPAWDYYFRIFNVIPEIGYCRILLTNSQRNGKAYFDNILLVRLDPIQWF